MSDSIWLILDRTSIFTGLLAFLGTIFSVGMWLRQIFRERTLRQAIPIRLVSEDGVTLRYELPYQPVRRVITRAEVLGLLGMIPSKQQRFDWGWLHDPKFMKHLEEIHQGQRSSLDIPISEKEAAQLDLPGSAI